MIRVSGKCGSRGQVSPTLAGKQIKCRKCGGIIAVPAQEPLIEPAQPPLIQTAAKPARPYSTSRWVVVTITLGFCVVAAVCAGFCAFGPRSTRPDYVDLQGNIEGTKWTGRDTGWDLEFKKSGRFALSRPIRDCLEAHWTGKYVLSGTSAVTLYMDDAIKGQKVNGM
jgi:hypothetical protein